MCIIGLDIGVSSIGWCVQKGQAILGLGVRVFPSKRSVGGATAQQQLMKHKAARIKNSKNRARLRHLADLLVGAGLLPADRPATTANVAQLFEMALAKPLQLFQFGAVLMSLTKHKGKPAKRLCPKFPSRPRRFNLEPKNYAEWQRRDATHAFSIIWRVQTQNRLSPIQHYRHDIAKCLFAQDRQVQNAEIPLTSSIPNTAGMRTVKQLSKVVDAIIRRFGVPEKIACEVFQRPLQNEEATSEKTIRRSAKVVSRQADLRHTLWLELPEIRTNVRQCVYTGEEIDLADIHSSKVEIDHIVPRSRGGRNSSENLLLCLAKANREKNNCSVRHVPLWQPSLDAILRRAGTLPLEKQRRLKNGTEPKAAYEPELGKLTRIAHLAAAEYLAQRFKAQRTKLIYFKGHETAQCRKNWQLDCLLSPETNQKNRNDSRHHAVDAFVLAHLAANAATSDTSLNSRLAIASILPHVLTSHKVDYAVMSGANAAVKTSGALTQETAFGPTSFCVEDDVCFGVIRKNTIELKDAKDIAMVRDAQLRDMLFAHIANRSVTRTLPEYFETGERFPKRVRVFERIQNPVKVRDGNGKIIKLLKSGANFSYDVWEIKDGKWLAEIVTMAQKQSSDWQSAIKSRYPTAKKVLKLHHNDCIALLENGQTKIMRVIKFSTNGRLCLAPINKAGDLKARDADKLDPFSYTVRSPAGLKNRGARQVRIDILGQISDPGCR